MNVLLLAAALLCACGCAAQRRVPIWAIPKQGTAYDQSTGLPVDVVDRETRIELVLIPAGSYVQGATGPEAHLWRDAYPPRRVVISKPFYLGKYEVTQGEWFRIMGTRPSYSRRGGRHPVEQVSWDDVQLYTEATGLRLPTEAEWEYGCRAGTTGPCYGPAQDVAWTHSDVIEYWAHPERNSPETRSGAPPVGLKKPNSFGLHDMLGSVEEWCADYFGPYEGSRGGAVDPTGPASGELRVHRGGCWYLYRDDLACFKRYASDSAVRRNEIGFRVARDP